MDTTQLLRGNASPRPNPAVISGYVSKRRPAPTSFTDPIWLIAPGHSENNPYGPVAWPALHGTTLPTQGAAVTFGIDDGGVPVVLWWAGDQSVLLTVTSLPAGVDGQEIRYLASATDGVVWNLKYRAASASTHKWEYLGGAPLRATSGGAPDNTASSTYQTTNAPSIVVPLAGDYECMFGCNTVTNQFAGANDARLNVFKDGAGAGDEAVFKSLAQGAAQTLWQESKLNGVTAGATLDVRHKSASSVSTDFWPRKLLVTPVRVG